MKYLNSQKGIVPIVAIIIIAVFMVGAFYLGKSSKQNTKIPVPVAVDPFSSGKIAFLKKDGNVYVAEKTGKVTQLTSDATDHISQTFDYPLKYRAPIWSPSGDKFAFQQNFDYRLEAHLLISDGKSIALKYNNVLGVYRRLPPLWYTNDKITIADKYGEKGSVTTSTLEGIEWIATNGEDSPYFPTFNMPDGCGGGAEDQIGHINYPRIIMEAWTALERLSFT